MSPQERWDRLGKCYLRNRRGHSHILYFDLLYLKWIHAWKNGFETENFNYKSVETDLDDFIEVDIEALLTHFSLEIRDWAKEEMLKRRCHF